MTNKLLANIGIESLNSMQSVSVQAALNGKSLEILSPTGSGKTLAYLLPAIQTVNTSTDALQVFVLLPTRELAQQSEDVLVRMKTDLRSEKLYGGRPTMEEHRRLKAVKPHIVFCTPGRLLDHIDKGNLLPAGCKLFVIDEFDKCLELGFREQMARIASHFSSVPQVVLTSATRSDETSAYLKHFRAIRLQGEAEVIDFLEDDDLISQRIRMYLVPSPVKDKLETLSRLLSRFQQSPEAYNAAPSQTRAVVFVAHRESAERVGRALTSQGFDAIVYHGGMPQEKRERALYLFRAGACNVLVSTDIASRGLDIPEVGAVIHYHPPRDGASLVHRSGRTARWDALGTAFFIVGPEEEFPSQGITEHVPAEIFETLSDINDVPVRPVKSDMAVLYIGRGKRDKISKGDIVGFFCKKGGLQASDLGRIDVFLHCAYVAVRSHCLRGLLTAISGEKLKGQKVLIETCKRG